MQPFSLVLGGGSARGIAHIGVIQRLEELNAKPSHIVGTSIGAIVGAFYAFGFTSTEMRQVVRDTKFLTLIDPDVMHGGIKGRKVMTHFKKYFGEKTFADAIIPLTIVATNIDTGEKVVFQEGRIIDALRASISIPGVFVPFRYHGMSLVDGGIVANLPIEFATEDEKVIAVSVQMSVRKSVKKESKKLFFEKTPFIHTYILLRKAVGIMITQNESVSIASRKNLLLIRPGRDDIDYYNFKKADALVEAGYEKSSEISQYLQASMNHG
ncbi:MAG: patatin-like phospholipase family protein [Candidatus Gracilibacteria bacterium]|nr:patatin-like phospholipase family protein [Candidatus Gracilibacteria bacterium]